LCTIFCTTLHAAEYVFTGTGSFALPANWENGAMPPTYNAASDIIRIKGHAIVAVSEACEMFDCMDPFWGNYGTIIIEKDASLDLRNLTQFENHGTIVVQGTLINTTNIEIYDTGDVIIWGTFINRYFTSNQGTFTVENGGKVENESNASAGFVELDLIGTLILKSGGTINFGKSENLQLGANFINLATLTGNVVVLGDLQNAGVLAPGNSPGTYEVKENYIAERTAVHKFEVGGTGLDQYDALQVAGTVTLAGALEVTLIDGFKITDDHEIRIITGKIEGAFSNVTLPNGYKLVYRSGEVLLQHLTVTPVTFVSLNASRNAEGVKLNWEVAAELGVKEYVVEGSVNGSAFFRVGSVPANRLNRYQFQDTKMALGAYYRIKSVDLDGTAKYSPVIAVAPVKQGQPISLFPSPAQTFVIVQHGKLSGSALLSIATADGKVIQLIRPEHSAKSTRVSLGNLPAGLYLIHLEDGGRKHTVKLVKQ
jgi:hypothetical protein